MLCMQGHALLRKDLEADQDNPASMQAGVGLSSLLAPWFSYTSDFSFCSTTQITNLPRKCHRERTGKFCAAASPDCSGFPMPEWHHQQMFGGGSVRFSSPSPSCRLLVEQGALPCAVSGVIQFVPCCADCCVQDSAETRHVILSSESNQTMVKYA